MKIFRLPIGLILITSFLSLNVLAQNFALDFDGIDDYVEIPNQSQLNVSTDLTIECLFNITGPVTPNQTQVLLVKSSGGNASDLQYALRLTNTELLRFEIGNGVSTSNITTTPPSYNEWHHIAGTFEASSNTLKIYIDGVQVASGTSSFSNITTNSAAVNLGRFPGFGQHLDGKLDEVRVWNTARTASEISLNYQSELTGNEAGLVAYYNMNEASGNTISDGTSYSNTGTLYNFNQAWISNCTVPNVDLGADINTCSSSHTISAPLADHYLWNTGETTQSITVTQSGDYSVLIDNETSNTLLMDTYGDYVRVPYDPSMQPTGAITISLWAKATDWQALNYTLFSNTHSGGYNLHQQNGNVEFNIRRNGSYGTIQYPTSSLSSGWHHFTASYDGQISTLYIDGVSIGTNDAGAGYSIQYNSGNLDVLFGSEQTPSNQPEPDENFVGNMDNIQIWSRALSASEVVTYMNQSPDGSEQDLEIFYDFEEGTGNTAIDHSPNGNNGTFVGASYDNVTISPVIASCNATDTINVSFFSVPAGSETIVTCENEYVWNGITYTTSGSYTTSLTGNNYSLDFAGANDIVSVPNAPEFESSTTTIECWVNPTNNTNTNMVLVAMRSALNLTRYSLHLNPSDNSIGLYAEGNGFQNVSHTFNINTWYHIVAIVNSNSTDFYVDGTLIGSTTNGLNNSITGQNLTFGTDTDASYNEPFDGKIESVALWNNSLDQTSIQNHMDCPLSGDESGLVGYWNFEEGVGSTVNDLTSNGNNGTITGATWDADTQAPLCRLTNVNGCDSTSTLNITFNAPSSGSSTITACDQYDWNGQILTTDGTYQQTFTNSVGCDSIHSLTVSFIGNDGDLISGSNAVCHGASLELDASHWRSHYTEDYEGIIGSEWNSNSTITYNNSNALGNFTNNTITLNLTDLPEHDSIRVTFDTYFIDSWDGSQSGSNDYWSFDIDGTNIIGGTFGGYLVSSQTYPVPGSPGGTGAYDSSMPAYLFGVGDYSSWYKFDESVDHTASTLSLSFAGANLSSPSDESWAIDNVKVYYYKSGTSFNWSTSESTSSITVSPETTTSYWVEQISGNDVCLDTLAVTVNPPLTGTDVITACGSYTWIDGTTYTASNNTAVDTVSTAEGCDSIVILNLTIQDHPTSALSATACDSYDWLGNTYTSTGTYTDTIPKLNTVENGTSMSFNGTNGHLYNSAPVGMPLNNFTVSADIKANTPSVLNRFINYGENGVNSNGWILGVNTQGLIRSFIFDDQLGWLQLNSNTAVDDGVWHNISMTLDGTTYSLYVDGVLDNSMTGTYNVNAPTNPILRIGRSTYSLPEFYDGLLDNVQVWDRVLSPNEISAYASCPPAGDEANLKAYYNFENAGATVTDVSGNGNDLTVNSATTSSDLPIQNTVLLCDTIATLNLTINNSNTDTLFVTACDSYLWRGTTYTSSGLYNDTLVNASGCDSVTTLNLTLGTTPTINLLDEVSICEDTVTVGVTLDATLNYCWNPDFDWTNISTGLPNSNQYLTNLPSMRVDENGTVYAIAGNPNQLYTYNGSSWDLFINIPVNYSFYPSDIDFTIHNGEIFIAEHSTFDTFTDIDVRKYDGAAWSNVINFPGDAMSTCNPTFETNSNGDLLLSFTRPNGNVAVYSYDGSTFNQLGSDLSAGTYSSLASNGVSTFVSNGSGKVFSFDGSVWSEIGTGLGNGNKFSLHLDAQGDLYYSNSSISSYQGTIYKYDGVSSWNQLGSALGGFVSEMNSSSDLVVAVTGANNQTSLKKFDGSDWVEFGTTYSVTDGWAACQMSLVDGDYMYGLSNIDPAVDLTLPLSIVSSTQSTCEGTSNEFLASIGTTVLEVSDAVGCSATDTVEVIQLPASTFSQDFAFDYGNSVTVGQNVYTDTGAYIDTLVNNVGCDSIVTTTLDVTYFHYDTLDITTCDNLPFEFNGNSYIASGSYNDTINYANSPDSVFTTHLTVLPRSFSETDYEFCDGDSVVVGNSIYFTTGIYIDTLIAANGCDSVITSNVNVISNSTSTTLIDVCDSYDWNGVTYDTTGIYTFSTLNSVGCDSTAYLDLTIRYSSASTTDLTVCDEYAWNGMFLTQSGTYEYNTLNADGCDSTATLNLTITHNTSSESVTECDEYEWNGIVYNTTGVYSKVFEDVSGCDSTAYLDLTILEPSSSITYITSCNSYEWNGIEYTQEGSFEHSFTNAVGCDSTATLILTLYHDQSTTETAEACESFEWMGTTYTESGTFTVSDTTEFGCDLVHTLNLTINTPSSSSTDATACNSYIWNDVEYDMSGTYVYSTVNAAGCDSTATLNLTINNDSESIEVQSTCDSYYWNGQSYTESGTYTHISSNASGCTHTSTLVLTVNNSENTTETVTACDSYEWRGNVYTFSGTYTNFTTTEFGCNLVETLVLTITDSSSSYTLVNECGSYDWNGVTYNTSGIYTYETVNSVGCDSTATLNLTITHSSESTETHSACDNYEWNGVLYTESGTYSYESTNADGCSHIDYLVLEIYYSENSTATVTSCDSYYWHGQTYNESGIYSFSATTELGCPWTQFLDLTILESSESFESVTECDSYEWNGVEYNTTGVYTFETVNAAGCDSTATLLLTINNSSESSEYVTECDQYEWNGVVYTESGTYTYESVNDHGCTLYETLVLTIYYSEYSTEVVEACDSYEWNGITYTESGLYSNDTITDLGCPWEQYLDLTILQSTSSFESRTECSSYFWNGIEYNTAGVYTFETANAAGCDSTATLLLTINFPTESIEQVEICDEYEWNGVVYTESGTYTHESINAHGCTHTATLDLTIYNSITTTESVEACDSYEWNGEVFTESGEYTFIGETDLGCTWTHILELTVHESSESYEARTECDSYWWNGIDYNTSGIYYFETVNADGCDSTAVLDLTVNYSSESVEHLDVCDSYEWNGNTYTESGTYTYQTYNVAGCDSTAILVLDVFYSLETTDVVETCDEYVWYGMLFTESGTYTRMDTTEFGCDWTQHLDLTVNQSSESYEERTECDSYLWNDVLYNTSGIYTFNTVNAAGCDSTATLVLTMNFSTEDTEFVTECDEYEWNGEVYTESGTYTFESENETGCTHYETLVLTIYESLYTTEVITACDSFEWNGEEYDESGTYTYETTTELGCPWIQTLELTINSSSESLTVVEECNEYYWNGITYNTSGEYIFMTTNAVGCDSIAVLDLTINYSPVVPVIEMTFSATLEVTNINYDSYTWFLYGEPIEGALGSTLNITESGVYSVVVTNDSGCGTWSEDFPVGVIGIDENSTYEFEVYPNPTRNFLNLNTPIELGTEYFIEMLDSRGRKVFSEVSNKSTQHVLDLNMLSQGMYHLTVRYANGVIWNEKVIIK